MNNHELIINNSNIHDIATTILTYNCGYWSELDDMRLFGENACIVPAEYLNAFRQLKLLGKVRTDWTDLLIARKG